VARAGENGITVDARHAPHQSGTAAQPTTARAAVLILRVLAALALTAGLVVVGSPASADAIRTKQWQLRALGAPDAWRYADGAGVTVAVLDSGVDAEHPDLVGQVLPGADFVDGSTDGRQDFVGHGTTVAALIAGRDDDSGVVGIAPHAMILPVRVLDAQNRYQDASTVAQGLRWAVDHGAQLVNMSLGGPNRSQVLADAIGYARAHGVIVVACTGNLAADGARQVWYPAREAGVVAVAGLGASAATLAPVPDRARTAAGTGDSDRGGDLMWAESLTGPQTVLTAPADDLVGARPGGYWRVRGTSFAAPMVTATATLIRSRWPRLDADNVINRMIRTARDLGPTGRDERYGYGEVQPADALTAELAPTRADPLALPGPKTPAEATPSRSERSAATATSEGQQPATSAGSGGPTGTATQNGEPSAGFAPSGPSDATPRAASARRLGPVPLALLCCAALLTLLTVGYLRRRRAAARPAAPDSAHPD
jgi:type VII secretion-associated serine protease mycosin